jgi:hypothetical protein
MGGSLAWLLLLGALNLTVLRRVDLDYFYLLTCAFVGWVAGAGFAGFCTVLSGVFLFVADTRSGLQLSAGILAWNTCARLLSFAAIG